MGIRKFKIFPGLYPGPPRGGESEGMGGEGQERREGEGKDRIEEREGQELGMPKEEKTSACTPWGL